MRYSVFLIRLKIAYFRKNVQIKEKLFSSFTLTLRGKWNPMKYVLKKNKSVFWFSSPLTIVEHLTFA